MSNKDKNLIYSPEGYKPNTTTKPLGNLEIRGYQPKPATSTSPSNSSGSSNSNCPPKKP